MNQLITIGIPTRNRLLPLLNVIHSIVHQTFTRYRLIISDDGNHYDIPTVIKRKFPQLVFDYVQGPGINLPQNRQCIFEHTTTEYVLMCDDDHYLESTCIAEMYRVMRSSGKIGIVSAIWPEPASTMIHFERNKDQSGYRVDLQGISIHSPYDWNRGLQVFYNQHIHPHVIAGEFTGGGCVLFRRAAVENAGGFPTGYSVFSFREDTDISHRVFLAGYKVLINPAAVAFHYQLPFGGVRDARRIEQLRKHDGELFLQRLAAWRRLKKKYGKFDRTVYAQSLQGHTESNVCSGGRASAPMFGKYQRTIYEALFRGDIEGAYVYSMAAGKQYPRSKSMRLMLARITRALSIVHAQWHPVLRHMYAGSLAGVSDHDARILERRLRQIIAHIRDAEITAGLVFILGAVQERFDPVWAIRSYRKGISAIRPYVASFPVALRYRFASVCQAAGDYAAADAIFAAITRSSRVTAFRGGALFHRGEIRYLQKSYTRAHRFFSACLEILPQHKKARDYVSRLNAGGFHR